MDSILNSIKKLIGFDETYTPFDPDIIFNINSSFSNLHQVGVGPENGFLIEDDTSVWTDFLGESRKLEMVKMYVYIEAKLIFDPPSSTAAIEAMKRKSDECFFRAQVAVEST